MLKCIDSFNVFFIYKKSTNISIKIVSMRYLRLYIKEVVKAKMRKFFAASMKFRHVIERIIPIINAK